MNAGDLSQKRVVYQYLLPGRRNMALTLTQEYKHRCASIMSEKLVYHPTGHSVRDCGAPKGHGQNVASQGQESETKQAGEKVQDLLVIRHRTPRHCVNCQHHHALVSLLQIADYVTQVVRLLT